MMENCKSLKIFKKSKKEIKTFKEIEDLNTDIREICDGAIRIHCKNLRVEPQKENNDIMLHLLQSSDIILLKHFYNIKELDRLLEGLDIHEEELINKCKDD